MTASSPLQELRSSGYVAARLGIHRQTAWAWMKEGKFGPVIDISQGGKAQLRVTDAGIEAYIASRTLASR